MEALAASFSILQKRRIEVRQHARAPDERIEQAKAMYLKGMKLVEIASQLNLPEGTVRRWKSTHKWDSERSDKNNERSDKKSRGGQPGNKNATGPQAIKTQSPRESLKLSFLIAWIRKKSSWPQPCQMTRSSFSFRKSSC